MAVCASIYAANQLWLKSVVEQGWVHSHLNDLLVMGVMLPYSNALIRYCRAPEWQLLGWRRVLPFTLVGGLFWEYIAPLYVPWSITDPWDIAAFLTGAAAYCALHALLPASSRAEVIAI